MPTYEYVCDACEHAFEDFQSMTEDAHTKCPKCKKKKLRRLFGIGAALIFKGSGFYETDYRSESYKAGAKKESDATKPATEAKSDGKPGGDAKTATDGKTDTSTASGGGGKGKKSSKSGDS